MKRLLIALILASLAFAQRTAVYNLGTLKATGYTIAVNLGPAAHKHTVQITTAGSPTTCSIQLEGTLDDASVPGAANWANLSGAQTCTSSVTFHVADRPIAAVRLNLTALSGGTSPSVTAKYLGVQ